MAENYRLVQEFTKIPDPNPTVQYVPGTGSAQNNKSDQWSQGPNGYPGNPPAGLGNSYNPRNPYIVKYSEVEDFSNLPIHYKGYVPTNNYPDELLNLRNQYTSEWLKSIDPIVAAQLTEYNRGKWFYNHNDITPLSTNGSRNQN